jgi:hypothetical protein
LVADAFIPNPDGKVGVNHLNGIKTDNRKANLERATPSENRSHAVAMGLHRPVRGSDSPNSKLTESTAMEIYKSTGRHCDISKKYGVCQAVVGLIKVGRAWTHVTGHVYIRRRAPNKRHDPRLK